MMYALDQVSLTANDLQKLNNVPTEVWMQNHDRTFYH